MIKRCYLKVNPNLLDSFLQFTSIDTSQLEINRIMQADKKRNMAHKYDESVVLEWGLS
ncbi:hypothetical protein I6N95_18795 [Vagococcus sp. BWB3-3]|uniref:Uncharacterized protein n=1 Tax=Vagococcus allomyrinae TaxID=2794353 RepID=A0A940PFL5_9ENTE|nr:hypothetical protein [Vagococcus allomyrinae]MBP1043068.1 hypothetical protein [Vagococcus allomyrinae]